MNLYLQRHCRPEPGARDDSTRPLTESGRQQAQQMGAWLADQIGRVDTVICSSFLRAIETAEIMAEALGSHIQRTPLLDPDTKPDEAWKQIQHMAGFSADVLVISHHPLVGHLIDQLGSVGGISHIFEHGSIASVDTYAMEMRWLVSPELVEHESESESALTEAAAALETLTEVDAPVLGGLKHIRHAQHLGPLRAKATDTLRSFFRRQKKLLLTQIRPKLREADATDKQKAAGVIPDALPISLTGGASYDYSKALSAAIEAGYSTLADEVGANTELAEDVVQAYLKDHSLTKLTGDFEATTVERLRNALADAYAKGADYEGLVEAVQDEYGGFNDVRAGMIAQTEMNAAYNAGRKQLGLDMGFNEKAWDPDGTACEEICVPNVLDGWIPIDDEFGSGDDAAPGHPACDCSLNVRYNPHTDAG